MSEGQIRKLSRGISCVVVTGGVQVELFSSSVVFDRPCIAALRLHALADVTSSFSLDCGGLSTATGRWWHDRAALLRYVAAVLIRSRARLWPERNPT